MSFRNRKRGPDSREWNSDQNNRSKILKSVVAGPSKKGSYSDGRDERTEGVWPASEEWGTSSRDKPRPVITASRDRPMSDNQMHIGDRSQNLDRRNFTAKRIVDGAAQGRPQAVNKVNNEPLIIDTEKPVVQEVHLKPEVVQRNKRLLAGLMGHLDLARKRLDADSARLDQIKSITLTASIKNESKSKYIAELKKRQASLENQKNTYTTELKKLTSMQSQCARHFESFVSKSNAEKTLLSTLTAPSLLWLPKQHSPLTSALVVAREEEIVDLIAKKQETLNSESNIRETRMAELKELLSNIETQLQSLDKNGIDANEVDVSSAENANDEIPTEVAVDSIPDDMGSVSFATHASNEEVIYEAFGTIDDREESASPVS